jgi:acyl carrier protein
MYWYPKEIIFRYPNLNKTVKKYIYFFNNHGIPNHPTLPYSISKNMKFIYQNDYENIYPIDEIIKRCPDIVKVNTKILTEVFEYKLGTTLDFNKTYRDQGLDELDCVEFIMELEKVLDITISDDVCEYFISENIKPVLFIQYNRNKKIEQLGL